MQDVKEVNEVKETKDKTKRAYLARAAAGLAGFTFAGLAIAIPIGAVLTLYVEPIPADVHVPHLLIGHAAYWLSIVSGFVFCTLLSVVLARYALRGRTPYFGR